MSPAIGGDFELAPELCGIDPDAPAPAWPMPLSGRTALHQVLLHLLARRPGAPVYLPSYLCDSMVRAALATGADVRFYAIGDDLRIAEPEAIAPGAIVVVVRYFGLVDLPAEIVRLRSAVADGLVVADEVHAPWALHAPNGADIAFTSWRKAYPVAGGAPIAPAIDWKPSSDPELFVVTRLAARAMKNLARRGAPVEDTAHLSLFDRAEALLDDPAALAMALPSGPAPLSASAAAAMDARRRRNFVHLQERVAALGLEPLLPLHPGATPLFLPVLLPAGVRDRVRRRLAEAQIYCPVHWPRPQGLPGGTAQTLYERELSLVVDFRYDETDMDRLAETLGRALARAGRS